MALINPVPQPQRLTPNICPTHERVLVEEPSRAASVLSLELTLAVTRGGEVGSAVHTPCTHAASPPVLSRTRIWLN